MGLVVRAGMLVLVLALAACGKPATPAERAALLGDWEPTDGSGHILRFMADGTFWFYYEPATWQLHWEVENSGQIKLSSDVTHEPYKDCSYTIAGDILHIDDGHGAYCAKPAVTPETPMPLEFKKAKPA